MTLTPAQIKAIASKVAQEIVDSHQPATDPIEKKLWSEGQAILEKLDNGVTYHGPWFPDGSEGKFFGHLFNDDAVTGSSFPCKDLEDCKKNLSQMREEWKAIPPVFRQEDVTGYQTAIVRNNPPAPLTWLYENGLIKGRALDYGSGRGCWYGMECYDPYYKPEKPTGRFETITCMYVLNVITEAEQQTTIQDILGMLDPGGKAYFAVRRDIPKEGKQGRGTFQRYVELGYPTVNENKGYALYVASAAASDFTIQENVKTCPGLLPMTEWIKGETPGTCRPCTLTPVVQWYWEELKERGLKKLADELEAEVNVLEEDNYEQVMALCEDLDRIKAGAPADLRKRLEEFDCSIQSFDPTEFSEKTGSAG